MRTYSVVKYISHRVITVKESANDTYLFCVQIAGCGPRRNLDSGYWLG